MTTVGMKAVDIKMVMARETYALRNRVLRPNSPPESSQFSEDSMPGSFHLAAVKEGLVVGIASVYPEAKPGSGDQNAWRLRGMATAPEVRGLGVGGSLLCQILEMLAVRGATYIWCNARTTATGFYERYGFNSEGVPFELPGVGPHYFMKKYFD